MSKNQALKKACMGSGTPQEQSRDPPGGPWEGLEVAWAALGQARGLLPAASGPEPCNAFHKSPIELITQSDGPPKFEAGVESQ